MGRIWNWWLTENYLCLDCSEDKSLGKYVIKKPEDLQQNRKQNTFEHLSVPIQRLFLLSAAITDILRDLKDSLRGLDWRIDNSPVKR